jgi:KaiC/GvpD/RAD55 family RecA-like ATPase
MNEYYKLYIEGLDEKMDDGIPSKHIVLLAGTPGTMKSTLAYYLLLQNSKHLGTKGLYLTLEQDRNNFKYHLSKLDLGEPDEAQLRIFDMSSTREQWAKLSGQEVEPNDSDHDRDLETFKRQIETLKKVQGFDLLVIDSLPIVELMFNMDNPREDLFFFFKWLKKLEVTTFLITEMSQDSRNYSKHDLDFLADGIIKLELASLSPTMIQRHIQIVKMRGIDHTTNPYVLDYEGGKFKALKIFTDDMRKVI